MIDPLAEVVTLLQLDGCVLEALQRRRPVELSPRESWEALSPTAMTDADEAVEADAEDRQPQQVTVTPPIADVVMLALGSKYPERLVFVKTITESPLRFEGRPDVDGYHFEGDTSVVRAAERLARLGEAR
jgi:hypothetical protein